MSASLRISELLPFFQRLKIVLKSGNNILKGKV